MLLRLTNITGVSEEVNESRIYVGRQEKCNTASIQKHMHAFCLCVSVCMEGGLKKCCFVRVRSYAVVSRCAVCEIKGSGLCICWYRTSTVGPFWPLRKAAQRRQMTFTSV